MALLAVGYRLPTGGKDGKLRRVCLSVGAIANGDPNSGLYTRTIDVAAALPKVYKQLSVSNFALVPSYITAVASANMGNNSSVFGGMEYDPEAGVLTVQPTRISNNNTFDGGAVVDVYCLYTAKASGPNVTGDSHPSNMAFYWIGCWYGSDAYTWIIPSSTDLVDVYFSAGKGATITFKTTATLQCRNAPQTYGGYCRIDGKNVIKGGVYNVTQGAVMQWTSTAGGHYYGAFDYA